jgi:prepilin-type N-terminal cleavage/methylation domain-containing protein
LRGQRGFTLIEMMIVVAIIALLSVMVIPSISSYFQVSIGSAARELAGTVKETYNSTVVTGKVHRLVYDFKAGNYWVEWADQPGSDVLLDTKQSRDREMRKGRFGATGALERLNKERNESFKLNKSVTSKKISLPTGVSFEDVLTERSPEPITEGLAYTHFFPHGIIEQTLVHLKDTSKHRASLILSPIVGKTDMYERYLTAKEAFGETAK